MKIANNCFERVKCYTNYVICSFYLLEGYITVSILPDIGNVDYVTLSP